MEEQNREIQKLQIQINILEDRLKKLTTFCAKNLLLNIHRIDKSMVNNLSQIGEAIKDPESFDIQDFRDQIAKGVFKVDQMDASLNEIFGYNPLQDGDSNEAGERA